MDERIIGMIRVLIVDDQELVCDGLQTILEGEFEIVGMAHNGAEALEKTAQLKPDVVLMDLKMPIMNGITATRLITEQFPAVKVLALTTFDADEWVYDAIRAGASSYLLKDSRREEIIKAVSGTAQGKAHIDPAVAHKLLTLVRQRPTTNTTLLRNLTSREIDLFLLIGQGLSNAEIAQQLNFSEGTIRNYVSALLDKLDVNDRTQAVALAWRHGLVTADDNLHRTDGKDHRG
jgi:DNA-binding NarL/FixJ family response regulator